MENIDVHSHEHAFHKFLHTVYRPFLIYLALG